MPKLPHVSKLVPGFLIAVALVFAVTSIVNDSQIVDEIPHVGAGYSYVKMQDMRLNPEHPPLAKDLAALPLLFMNLDQKVFQSAHWTKNTNDQWEFGRALIYGNGDKADAIKFWSRIPMLLFYVLSAILIFKWGRELYGDTGGMIGLVIFLFSPTVMAHSRFVTTDVPSLFGVLASTYYFLRYLEKPTKKNLVWSGLTLGVALLLKFNTFLLLPFFVGVALLHGLLTDHTKRHRIWHILERASLLIFVFAIAGVLVWIVYGFHVLNYPPERQLSDTQYLLGSFGNRFVADIVIWMADKPFIRAFGNYLLGFLMVVQRSAGGNTIYFLGEVKNQGGPLYFPLVYFLKEPLAWWFLVFTALMGGLYRVMNGHHSVHRIILWIKHHFPQTVMLLWLALYWLVSIRSTLNIGVRHLMPTFPFAILLVAGQIAVIADWMRRQEDRHVLRWFSGGIAVLLGWLVFENLSVYPKYLTYFNQLAGGPSGGHQYVTDSNLDWGQDLKRLGQFVEQNNIPRISVDYFGWADPRAYLGDHVVWTNANTYNDAQDFMRRNQTGGWLAISATFFQQASSPNADRIVSLPYLWLKAYKPVAVVGNSIFVWHITKQKNAQPSLDGPKP